MSVSVTMPQLGESVTEGTVTRWLKAVGDTVTADEPLLEVSTDKVDTEIPAPASGVLVAIRAQVDETVAVGAELAVIGSADDSSADDSSADDGSADVGRTAIAAVTTPEVARSAPTVDAPRTADAPRTVDAAPLAATATESTPVILPALGESVTEGTVTRWLKAVGDTVQADEPLVEVSTDKVDTEIPAPTSGVLLSITVAADGVVAVGGELGRIGGIGGASTPATPTGVAGAPPAATTSTESTASAAPTPESGSTHPAPTSEPAHEGSLAPSAHAETYVTPLVRRLAAQHGVDLTKVQGSGVGGRIRKADVLAAAESGTPSRAPAPTSAPGPSPVATAVVTDTSRRRGTEPLSRLRRIIAERMVESLQTSAQLTTVVEVDVTRIAMLRQRVKADFAAREGVTLSFLPFFCKAAVEALKQFPVLNASIDMAAGTVTYHEAENLGVAVDTDRGLLVPVIANAGELSIAGLARRIADLAERTRTNRLGPDELASGTFTVTNTGSRGALFDTPIVNPPQVAILGTGAVVKRPAVVTDDTGQDVVAVRSMVYLALSYDHRLVDGADAARFLTTIRARLEEGAFEAELGL